MQAHVRAAVLCYAVMMLYYTKMREHIYLALKCRGGGLMKGPHVVTNHMYALNRCSVLL
jgi:hypothetical protein